MNARITNRALQPLLTPFRSGCALRVAGRARPQCVPRRAFMTPRADMKRNVEGIVRAGDRIADSVAGILPGSVPRGAAKIGILGVGGLIAFSVLQKIFSTFFFLAIIGGAAFLWVKLSSRGGDGGGSGGSSNGDDPLSNARRIMDKYNGFDPFSSIGRIMDRYEENRDSKSGDALRNFRPIMNKHMGA